MNILLKSDLPTKAFKFKQFTVEQDRCAMKITTDSVLLGAWADSDGAKSILDIGTGTGIIALMLAQRNAQAEIHGVEIDSDSAEQASSNFKASPWADRLRVHRSAVQDFDKTHFGSFDLIVSNPPFFTGGVIATRETRNHARNTVRLPHGDLLQVVRRRLSENGRFCLVLPLLEGLRFREMAENTYGLQCTRLTEVRSKAHKPVERLLMEFALAQGPVRECSDLVLQGDDGSLTDAYTSLTKMFYLNL
jgi:tRNA1Val (adenine37-N6)-methyltransferase